jgi:hypothetical protein
MYDILKAHTKTDGTEKSLPELEMEYVQLTDKLIHNMTHGIDFRTPEHTIVHEKPTVVVFFDKSARPVSWLTRELWDTLAPEPGSDEIPEQPDFKFLNIDRNRLRKKLDPNGCGKFDASYITEDQIIGLRSIFNVSHDGSYDTPNALDNQKIMLVDEMLASGATMEIATSIIRRAFPTSLVQGTYWMEKKAYINGAEGNADAPIWYNANSEMGRGVGDALPNESITDPAQLFLSRRFPVADEKSLLLREDFKTLARSVGKSVLYLPHNNRDDESQDLRAIYHNNKSFDDTLRHKKEILQAHKNHSRR